MAKVHIGSISYKLSCGLVAEGFRQRTLVSKFGTSPNSHHVDDMGSSPICTEIFTGYPTATVHINIIKVKFPVFPD